MPPGVPGLIQLGFSVQFVPIEPSAVDLRRWPDLSSWLLAGEPASGARAGHSLPRVVRPSCSELLDRLTEGVAGLSESKLWQRYLTYQGKFHRYSATNVLLIAAQRPDATQVAGFAAWKRFGRVVRRGEHAIWIVAPIRRSSEVGEEILGFRAVAVFDVSQTEGDALPSVCSPLTGSGLARPFAKLLAVAGELGYRVEHAELGEGVSGDCTYALRRIRIALWATEAQQVKTLAHELAHGLLHEGVEDRALAELEAESVAYVVCGQFGVDSGDYSFGYVTTWAGGTEAAVTGIKASCGRIARAAQTILATAPERESSLESPEPPAANAA